VIIASETVGITSLKCSTFRRSILCQHVSFTIAKVKQSPLYDLLRGKEKISIDGNQITT